jgi:hypothetical protein
MSDGESARLFAGLTSRKRREESLNKSLFANEFEPHHFGSYKNGWLKYLLAPVFPVSHFPRLLAQGRFEFPDSAQCFKPLLKVTAIDQIKDFEFFGL